jgi:hypothetical protein
MTQEQLAAAISPSVDRARGLCEVFYQRKPFADDNNPTRADVDEWHRIAINHVRALVAYASEERQVKKDHCMFARALWGDERKYTTLWDAKYPGTVGSASGPCQVPANAHCDVPPVAARPGSLPARRPPWLQRRRGRRGRLERHGPPCVVTELQALDEDAERVPRRPSLREAREQRGGPGGQRRATSRMYGSMTMLEHDHAGA